MFSTLKLSQSSDSLSILKCSEKYGPVSSCHVRRRRARQSRRPRRVNHASVGRREMGRRRKSLSWLFTLVRDIQLVSWKWIKLPPWIKDQLQIAIIKFSILETHVEHYSSAKKRNRGRVILGMSSLSKKICENEKTAFFRLKIPNCWDNHQVLHLCQTAHAAVWTLA